MTHTPYDADQRNELITMPPPEVLYLMARRLKERAKHIPSTWGSDSTQESLSNKLNDMGNKILVANGGR